MLTGTSCSREHHPYRMLQELTGSLLSRGVRAEWWSFGMLFEHCSDPPLDCASLQCAVGYKTAFYEVLRGCSCCRNHTWKLVVQFSSCLEKIMSEDLKSPSEWKNQRMELPIDSEPVWVLWSTVLARRRNTRHTSLAVLFDRNLTLVCAPLYSPRWEKEQASSVCLSAS